MEKKKKYNDFENFINDSCHLTEYIDNSTKNMNVIQKIDYARTVFAKEILNSYLIVGKLNENIIKLLDCKNNILMFSTDNMIKK